MLRVLKRLICLVGVGVCLPWAAQAAVLDDLYRVEEPVSNRSAEVRQDALTRGLESVLIKVTGNALVAQEPGLKASLEHPERWVLQYVYRQRDDGRLVIAAEFNERAIYEALQNYGLMFWPKSRAEVLVWMAVEDGVKRSVITASDQQWLPEMQKISKRRGVPFILPLYDLEDQARVPFTTIWGGFDEDVAQASQRYEAPALLVVKVQRQASGGWRSEWRLRVSNELQQWQAFGDTPDVLVAEGMSALADYLAQRYAFIPSEMNRQLVDVSVTDVNSAEALAKLERFLKGVSGVKSVFLYQVTGFQFDFQLEVEGQVDAVLEQLNRSDLLLFKEQRFGEPPRNTRLNIYQLL